MTKPIRVGLVGAGANMKLRHIPGLRSQPDVEIVGVSNRRPESTQRVAQEYAIPKTYTNWSQLVVDDEIDAVVIGTWPYLHAEISVAALNAGKHVLCEARMARDLAEADQMFDAAQSQPQLVAQLVPSPFGFKGDNVMRRLLAEGFVGDIREVHIYGMTDALADPDAPLHWRQNTRYSGKNMLTLGILHETAMRWLAPVVRVRAQAARFTMLRHDGESQGMSVVGTPDSVQVLTEHADGSRGVYQFSGSVHFGPGHGIVIYGSVGTIHYRMNDDVIMAAQKGAAELQPIEIKASEEYGWNVEAEFIAAIRDNVPFKYTDFATGVKYMAFTEAVHESALHGTVVEVR